VELVDLPCGVTNGHRGPGPSQYDGFVGSNPTVYTILTTHRGTDEKGTFWFTTYC